MAQRKKKAAAFDVAAVEAAVRETVARDGAIKISAVKPAAARTAVVEALLKDGLEVTASFVRRPLADQLREALAHGALVPAKGVGTHVRGASAAELKLLVESVLRAGTAKRVLRGTVEVLVGPGVKVLSPNEVEALRGKVVALGKALEKVTRKPGATLLAVDVREQLADAVAALGPGSRDKLEGRPDQERMSALLQAVDAVRDGKTGLSFVPAVVGKVSASVDARSAIQLLLSAAEQELLELRPEGGIGRLSEAELSVCPPGPHGTRLSWARRLPGGAT